MKRARFPLEKSSLRFGAQEKIVQNPSSHVSSSRCDSTQRDSFLPITMAATSGTWSNLADWLLCCLLHERDVRVLVHYKEANHRTNDFMRKLFVRELVSAFSRFANLSVTMRGGMGLNAIEAQSSLRSLMAESGCLVVNPTTSTARVFPAAIAKREAPRPLIIGIAMVADPPHDLAFFRRICRFDPEAAACPLPALPAPMPRAARPIVIDDQDEKGGGEGEGEMDESLSIALPEEKEDVVDMEDADEDDDKEAAEDGTMAAFFSKCPICLEIPFPPWQTTTCGHLICTECHAKLPSRTTCPTCRQTCATTLVPQLLFAEVAKANQVKLRCRHDGCGRRIPWDMARAHHAVCAHRARGCIIEKLLPNAAKCEWQGPISALGQHLIDKHGAFERTDRLLSVTRSDESHLLVWTPEQAVVKVHHLPAKAILGLSMVSLGHKQQRFTVHVDTIIGDFYKGTCTLAVASGSARLVFHCPDPRAPFTFSLTCGDKDDGDVISKKRMRDSGEDDDDDGDGPKVKVARVSEEEHHE